MTKKLTPAALKLLKTIAAHDTGAGVAFSHAPAGRWQMDATGLTVNDRTFHPLTAADLIDIGNGHTDRVKVTAAGRAYLAA
jgi:isocitrate/isopropylmalate dehydrogenase